MITKWLRYDEIKCQRNFILFKNNFDPTKICASAVIAKSIFTLNLYFNRPKKNKKMEIWKLYDSMVCLQHKAGTFSLRVLVPDTWMTVPDWCLLLSLPTNSTVCSFTTTCMEPTSTASMSTSRSELSSIVTYHINNIHF